MERVYEVNRKLQEQSGSYFVVLPKLWVDSYGLKQGALMSVTFNGEVKIRPPSESLPDAHAHENIDSKNADRSQLSDLSKIKEVRKE